MIGILPYCKIVLLESYACVHHPSLTVRLLNNFVDLLCVQWPYLLVPYPYAIYTGLLPLNGEEDKYLIPELNNDKKFAFVTVGSTNFDDLIKSIDNMEFINKLQKQGFTGIHIQKGNGKYDPENIVNIPNFETKIYEYCPSTTVKEEIENCSLVIGHAGTGTIFETLQARKNLLVVPNTTLMNNHQIEIAEELGERDYLSVSDCEHLIEAIDNIFTKKLKLFPNVESLHFKVALYSLLGLDNDLFFGGN